jgi:peptide chain release factor 1
MFDKFEWMQNRYEELSTAVSQPDIIADQAQWQKLVREHAQLEPSVRAWEAYQQLLSELTDAQALLKDPDLADMAQEELRSLNSRKEEAEQHLKVLLLPQDPNDQRNIIMEIRGGAGGEEASLFAAELMRMYTRYAERHNWRVEPVSINATELGGVKEAVFSMYGNSVFSRLKFESGVHRVQRVPATENSGRIHTSTCTVAVLPEAEDVEINVSPGDLRIDVYRSTGHGGQCINTTDSAVRITHLPTGLVVTCQDEKSQIKNKDKAMKVLKSRLLERMQAEKDAEYAQNRRGQIGTGDRSERIRTYNFPQGRVTDHRIGLTLYRINDIIDGDLDEIIDALRVEEQAQLLRQLSQES